MIWKKTEAEDASVPVPSPPQPPTTPTTRTPPQSTKEHALIGSSIEIKGNLSGTEDLIIEGRIDGKIELLQCTVTVGKSGRVNANIAGRMIVIMGEVNGDLYAEEQIILRQSSAVNGNLFSPRVILEDGARFKGSIDMTAKAVEATPLPITGS